MAREIYGGNVRDRVVEEQLGADETASQSLILSTAGLSQLEVNALADTATTFRVDFSNDKENWITDHTLYEGVKTVNDGFFNTFKYVRLRSDSAGSDGDTVDLRLTAGGQ